MPQINKTLWCKWIEKATILNREKGDTKIHFLFGVLFFNWNWNENFKRKAKEKLNTFLFGGRKVFVIFSYIFLWCFLRVGLLEVVKNTLWVLLLVELNWMWNAVLKGSFTWIFHSSSYFFPCLLVSVLFVCLFVRGISSIVHYVGDQTFSSDHLSFFTLSSQAFLIHLQTLLKHPSAILIRPWLRLPFHFLHLSFFIFFSCCFWKTFHTTTFFFFFISSCCYNSEEVNLNPKEKGRERRRRRRGEKALEKGFYSFFLKPKQNPLFQYFCSPFPLCLFIRAYPTTQAKYKYKQQEDEKTVEGFIWIESRESKREKAKNQEKKRQK